MKPGDGRAITPVDLDKVLRGGRLGAANAAPSITDYGASAPTCSGCNERFDGSSSLSEWSAKHQASCAPTKPYEAAADPTEATDAAIVEAAAKLPDPPPSEPEE